MWQAQEEKITCNLVARLGKGKGVGLSYPLASLAALSALLPTWSC